jgi:hypothetical protein
MSKHEDKLSGGKADNKQPKDFDSEQLAAGIKHEMEHTDNKTVAQEIAMDHLSEDADYYKKLKTIEKQDRVEVTPDGKTELDYGKEKLDKKPMKKSLLSRWDLIKKELDNNSAILDLSTMIEDDEEDQPEIMDDGGQEDAEADEAADGERPEWLPDHMEHDGEEPELHQDEDMDQDDQNGDLDDEGGEQELIDALRELGHSDSEIAHIVHGHMTPPVDEAKRAKAAAEYAGIDHDKEAHQKEMEIRDREAQIEAEHAQRMKDVEYQRAQKESGETDLDLEHKRRLQDLEYQKAKAEMTVNEAQMEAEHKKRMLELEYETAKKQKEIELEYKKKELEMKIKHNEEIARQKHKDKLAMAKEDGKNKMAEKKADSKKVKKSEDEQDDLQKAVNWKFSRKSNQLVHPEHGFIAVNQLPSGAYEIKHNGTSLGRYAPEHVKDAITYHTDSISTPVAYDPQKTKMQRPPTIPKPYIDNPPGTPTEQEGVSPAALAGVNERYGKLYHPDLSGTIDYKKKGG